MNYIEDRIKSALRDQLRREELYITNDSLDRLASAVRARLDLKEHLGDGDRWWSTRFYPPHGLSEMKWLSGLD